jgi:methyl-accepting chemotaxis protein
MMKSLQTKLTVVILVIFLVALGALGGLNYWKARDIVVEKINGDLSQIAEATAEDIGDWLVARQGELQMIAAAPAVLGGDKAAMAPFLVNAGKTNPAYDTIGYIAADGSYINSIGAAGSLADREYFKLAMKGVSSVSDPLQSKSTGHLVTVVAVPVKTDGKVTGVVYGAVDMAGLAKKVTALKIGKTGYAYMVQGDGLMIMHPSKERAMKTNVLQSKDAGEEVLKASQRMVKGEKGFVRYQFQGSDKMQAFAPVPGVKWSLVATATVAEMTEAVAALTLISGITILVVMVVAALAVIVLTRRIVGPIRALVAFANEVAAGDVSERQRTIYSQDEIGQLADAMFKMRENLRSLIRQVRGATDQVAASSEELTASSEQTAQAAAQVAQVITEVTNGAERQLKAVDSAASVVTQMSAGIQQVAANANHLADQSAQAAEKAKNGGQAVEKAVGQMTQIESTAQTVAAAVAKLGEQSQEIGQIVGTISGIAGQTNLLALNAAIEAARAGEQGRGFAVVAEEVRKLAEESQDAAKKIAELVEAIQADTGKAVAAMNASTGEVKAGTEIVTGAGVAFREIVELVTTVSTQVREISAAVQQMAAGSQQIVAAVRDIDAISRDTAGQAQTVSAATEEQSATMEEIASSSQALAKMAEELQTAVARFRL